MAVDVIGAGPDSRLGRRGKLATALAALSLLWWGVGCAAVGAADERPHVVMMISEVEYHTERTLPEFARRRLGHDFRVTIVHGDAEDGSLFPGLEETLADADVLVVSVRRRTPPPRTMAAVRKYVEAKKPVVGIRTASHAFSLRNEPAPAGRADWTTWDADVFGGHYTNHYKAGPTTAVTIVPGRADAAILTGVTPFESQGSLYQVSPLAKSATPLLMGAIPGQSPEPVAWTNTTTFGGPAFYTSLGHETDFAQPAFERLLFNAIHVAAGRDVPATMPDPVGSSPASK